MSPSMCPGGGFESDFCGRLFILSAALWSKTDSKSPYQENAQLSKMNQLPIIYQERFTFDPSEQNRLEYFRIFISRIFLNPTFIEQ